MSRKMSAARLEVFFRALSETGNQTIAAERAKVSRSWVVLHRADDPAFRERMDAALAEAKARLSGADGVAPPTGWGSLDGEELVVRGGKGRRVQIARARLRQWTPRLEARSIATLAATCNVKAACAAVGLSAAAAAYGHAKRAPGFLERWQAAIEEGYLRIEAQLLERASQGLSPPMAEPEGAASQTPLMTDDEAFQQLYMHRYRLRGVGGRPGVKARKDGLPEALRVLLRNLDRIERRKRDAGALDARQQARDPREWARRGGGCVGGTERQ